MEHSNKNVHGLILAAGKGSRMGAALPKPLVPLAGKALLDYLLDAFEACGLEGSTVVVGYEGALVESHVGDRAACCWQHKRLGTAHAVESALPQLQSEAAHLLVFVGDSPLLRPETIGQLIHAHVASGAACTFLTATFEEPFPYARVIVDENGKLLGCVEERDASPTQKQVREYLSSHFIFQKKSLLEYLPRIQAHPKTGERYLTDMIPLLLEAGLPVSYHHIPDYRELVGLNTPGDLLWAEQYLKQAKA